MICGIMPKSLQLSIITAMQQRKNTVGKKIHHVIMATCRPELLRWNPEVTQARISLKQIREGSQCGTFCSTFLALKRLGRGEQKSRSLSD